MKKLLMSSVVLFLFAASITMVQVSCSKSNASPAKTTNVAGKVLYTILTSGGGGHVEFWIADYDGSNKTQVNLALPANVSVDQNLSSSITPRLSPDATKIFFQAIDNTQLVPLGI